MPGADTSHGPGRASHLGFGAQGWSKGSGWL